MKEYYCDNCNAFGPTHIIEREETFPVKGDPTTIFTKVRICDICGGDSSDSKLIDESLLRAYDKYRGKHGIISRDEIRKILRKYGLTQRSLAALLGWGEITIHRYEKGSIPDEAHNLILKFIEDPVNMQRLFDEHKDRLNPRALKKLEAKLNELHGGKGRKKTRISKSN
ncbi:MAG: helix-turn-helix domain-containing protein [bacterium]|nr:helix-turn-helix domain-containing protein [bacterium]